MPNGLNQTMFANCLEQFTTDEQKGWWLEKQRKHELIGCYAQTEIGHGSNVAGLRTTATFDKATDEFVIHTPDITATKFWSGDMGLQSNCGIVYARLISNGKDHGVHPFFFQLRNYKTHERLPGIQSGDLGAKITYNAKDNGWLSFDNVRIPRKNMLMKFAKVDREGNFSVEGDLRVLYAIMLFTRINIHDSCSMFLSQSLTIAARYAAVRRQFSTQEGTKKERRLLDYQTHQYKLLPALSSSFAFFCASK